MGEHRLGGHLEPRILLSGAPAGEDEPTARPQRPAQVGEGGDWVAEEHHAEAGEDELHRGGRERVRGGVGFNPCDVRNPGGACARTRQHRRRDIEADHPPLRADGLGQHERRRPIAAPDIEHRFALAHRGVGEQGIGHRGQHGFRAGLVGHPAFPAGTVPESDLPGVQLGWVTHRTVLAASKTG
jgi:hypothetical protein